MTTPLHLNPEEALRRLSEGNERFTQDRMLNSDKNSERREAVTNGQTPFAIIVGCSDSRVSPEIIFDQGLGDLFVVRVAGNVMGPIELASIYYAASVLNSSLVIVLGHESCGAVTAVLEGNTKNIEAVAALIVAGIGKDNKPCDIAKAVRANVQYSLGKIKSDVSLARLIAEKRLKAVGGYYNLHSGQVEILD